MTNTTTKSNPFHSLKFCVSENMAAREFVAIDYHGNKSAPFKIKAGTRGQFFILQSAAMKAANAVNEFYGEDTPMDYQRLECAVTGTKWHYLEIL